MKSKLLIMGVLCAIAFTTNAQTKGTNTLGFGVNLSTSKPNENVEVKNNNFSIGYGHFIKDNVRITNNFNVGAFGGLTWFLSKRFALETSLLSADISYQKTKQTNSTTGPNFNSENTSFNLNTQGLINNLGFKIYILF